MTINLKAAFRETDAFIEDAEPDMDARSAAPLSVSAEDFSFRNSFDSLKGQTESLSVSGVTGSIDTIEKAVSGRDRDDKDDDKDGIGWEDVMEAQDRIRAEIMRIGNMNMTRAQVDATIEFLSNPENREAAAKAYAEQNGATVQKAKQEIDLYAQYLAARRAIDDGNATAEQQSFVSQYEAQPDYREKLEKARNASVSVGAENRANNAANLIVGDRGTVVANASTGNTANDDAVAANIQDNAVWEDARVAQGITGDDLTWTAQTRGSGDVGALAFSDTRSGPVITSVYNDASAAGEQQLAQAQAPAEPAQRSNNAEFGLG